MPEDRRQHGAVHGRHLLRGVEAGGAEMRLADQAEPALAAWRAPGEDDVVALRDIRDALADLLDDAAPSCPSRKGNHSVPKTPFFAERSVWQTPLARMRTSASPGPGCGNEELLDHSGFAGLAGDDAARGNRIGHAENLLVLLSIW